jgi:Yersinia/Haemophilus virulence surface antigen
MTRQYASVPDAVAQVRREALACGASSITLCTQAMGVLADELKLAGKASGLCRSMAMRWLAGRHNGTNFLAQLLKPGGVVDSALVKAMANEYDEAGGGMDFFDQAGLVVAELGRAGLKSTGVHIEQSVGDFGMIGLGAWFTQNSQESGTGRLRFISVYGGYNHAMAMDLREQYAIFFDPNFGAFTFPTHLKMVNFLAKIMFTREGTQFYYAASKPFSIATKIGFS